MAPSTKGVENVAKGQEAAATQAFSNSNLLFGQGQNLLTNPTNFLTGITSPSSTGTLQAASPLIGQISAGQNAARESLLDRSANPTGGAPKGAGLDAALAAQPFQEASQIATALNSTYLGALQQAGSLGLSQEGGAGGFLNSGVGALSGASQSEQAALSAQEQAKQSTMSFLGQIVGAGASIATGGLSSLAGIGKSVSNTSGGLLGGPIVDAQRRGA